MKEKATYAKNAQHKLYKTAVTVISKDVEVQSRT